MRVLLSSLALLVATAIPSTVFAAETVWELAGQKKLEGWSMGGLTSVNLFDEGLHIQTETEGQLIRNANLKHIVDRVAITYASPVQSRGMFIWSPPGETGMTYFKVPVTFSPAAGLQTAVLDLQRIDEWDPSADRIGFVFYPGADVLIQKVEFVGDPPIGKIGWALKTMWKFDTLRPYSINFLWGPMMTYNEMQYNQMFTRNPPMADSAMGVLYTTFAILFVVIAITGKIMKKQWRYGVLILIAVMWILYDVRMTTEFFTYVQKDYATWWSQPVEDKVLRDRGDFNAFAEAVAPLIEGHEHYAFVSSRGWPYTGSMRYYNYPAEMVPLEKAGDDIDLWVIYDRPDITVSDDGRLLVNGEAASPQGTLLYRFDDGAFVFSLNRS